MSIHLQRQAAALLISAVSAPLWAADPQVCEARSSLAAVPVVELYTSEGCSSCPPADRWLSTLRGEPQVVALSFHVDYWDYLGWKDRFARAQFSQWQSAQLSVNGARNPYTPQVVVNGADQADWWRKPALSALGAGKASPVSVHLRREGAQYQATVLGLSNTPAQLAAYWAVTEGPYETAVKAGENRGERLSHDFIVRELKLVPVWAAAPQASQTLAFSPSTTLLEGAAARQVNLVVLDSRSGRPVQAIKLGC